MATEKVANNAASTLNGTIGANPGTLTVNSATPFPAAGNFRILIDSEILLVTAVAGAVFTVTGGQEGTTAAGHSNGATVTQLLTAGALAAYRADAAPLSLCEGRLTLTSGTPVTTADVTGATSIFFTPYKGNRITLWDGAKFVVDQFTEITIALGTLTSGLPYDLFAFDTAGVVAFDAPLAWTSNTARATALAWSNGMLIKSGDATRRYVGTFYTTGTTTTEDSQLRRFVWNMENRVKRFMNVTETTTSWSVNQNGTWRQANGNTANKIQGVIGWPDSLLDLSGFTIGSGTIGGQGFDVGIGEDSTTAVPAQCYGMIGVTPIGAAASPTFAPATCRYCNLPAAGFHAWNWLENTDNNNVTFFGVRAASAGNSQIRSGLVGHLEG
jgi:hypothetical protein